MGSKVSGLQGLKVSGLAFFFFFATPRFQLHEFEKPDRQAQMGEFLLKKQSGDNPSEEKEAQAQSRNPRIPGSKAQLTQARYRKDQVHRV